MAVNKPGGVPSQPDASGDRPLDAMVREWLRVAFAKRGKVYLALLHRLDRPTSGVVLLSRTEKAAGRMAELFRRREIAKTYLAVVETAAGLAREGELVNYLEPAGNGGMRLVERKTAAAREARLGYRVLAESPAAGRALLEVDLQTGVKHQIRCQLAGAGWPVVGDFRYGAFGGLARPEAVFGGRAILLHAWRVGFVHPVRREALSITAPLPGYWREGMRDFPEVEEASSR